MADSDTDLQEFLNRLTTLVCADSVLTLDNKEVLLINKLKGLVTNVRWRPADAVELFTALLKRFESTSTNERPHLHSWMMEMLHSIEINYVSPSLNLQNGKTVMQLVCDATVTDDKLLELLGNDTAKKLEDIIEEIRQKECNQVDETLLEEVKDIVSSVAEDLDSPNGGSQQHGLKKQLLHLCRAVKKTKPFTPQLTQMVSWCLMALSKSGWLIQVGTGEGKSCIVAMFAAFRVLRGETVDIMSSSPVLAERDLMEWQGFFKHLEISVDCNTNKFGDEALKKCYTCKVVYGTAEQFAGDWLRHHFHRKDTFGQRKLQCAIVDEVDSLMLDKGLHMVYLSSDMPAMQHLSPLLGLIWATVNQYCKIDAETTLGPKYPFQHVVFENISKSEDIDEFTILQMAEDTGTLAKGSVHDIRNNPSLLTEKIASVTANQLAEFFKTVEMKFPSCHFALHTINNDGTLEEMNTRPPDDRRERRRVPLVLVNGGFCRYTYSSEETVLSTAEVEIKRFLHFTPCELSQDTNICYVPGFLTNLVNSKLKVWIENALLAQTMTMDHEYIIEGGGVVPVDYSCTGVVENNMKWSDGIQQFLEMKHQTKLSDMTVITNYMSNVGLLQKYGDQIYGISGTLGQQSETETLQKLYTGIKTCQIPSFKRRKLFEVEGVIVDDEEEWTEKICSIVTAQLNPRAQRAVLVICETINRAKALYRALQVRGKKLYINNNMDNSAIFKKELEAGEVIVATNLAGRGTDLQVSDPVNCAGGLFVVQTFLPKNARVEQQAFGRTARQGFPGSAQLIICSTHLSKPLQLFAVRDKLRSLLENMIDDLMSCQQELFVMQFRLYEKSHRDEDCNSMSLILSHILTKTSNSGINMVKRVRDSIVANRLSSYLVCNIPNMKKKEELFSQYLVILDDLYKNNSNKPADSDLSSLNETWGLWLLMNFSDRDSIVDLKSRLKADMQTARQKLALRESSSSILHHYTGFGNDLRKNGKLSESIDMYSKAIQKDHCWAAVALYNRAFASLAQQDRNQDRNCINQALEDLRNALKSIEFYCKQNEVTYRYSLQGIRSPLSNSVTRFAKHMGAKQRVLELFKANINQAIQKLERARDNGGNVKVDEKSVCFLTPLVDLITTSISLIQIVSLDVRKMQEVINDPYCDIFRELECLESLGLTDVYTLDTLFSLGGYLSKIFNLRR